ncbi:DNA starvation/stationary phase protection protein [Lactobacillus sp. CC-MHH1034]|uniref:ferritin-like domain-containing protein n=1 Tax=Agrilactobacillus fermenti TaxID=2586909 RepID=UPI001E2E9825|nr:ferritin-like domain-containing protein [Agrilactobacillus fermenti]MCD2257020.1 DNA starvation/stationary phase protection protein [Agrilactobacillus fermenti]
MDATKIDAVYRKEVEQADKDHHTPTAGAMTGHILANLKLQSFKLEQYMWYAQGENTYFKSLYDGNQQLYFDLAKVMLAEHELVPTTVKEMTDYAMIEDGGRNKYQSVTAMLNDTGQDFAKANLFVTRAIKLAQKEERYPLAQQLIHVLGVNEQNIWMIEQKLGQKIDLDLDDEA